MPLAETQIIVIGSTSGMGLVIAIVAAEKRTRVVVGGSRDDRVDSAIKGIEPRAEDIAAAADLAMVNGYLAGAVIDVDGGGLLV